jgi:hypothetical protein
MRRTVTAPVELHRRVLDEGDAVVMWYPGRELATSRCSGRPAEQFDIAREPNQHQAFGVRRAALLPRRLAGPARDHCMLDELVRRLPDIHGAASPSWANSNFILGPIHLPVAYTPSLTPWCHITPQLPHWWCNAGQQVAGKSRCLGDSALVAAGSRRGVETRAESAVRGRARRSPCG